MVCCVSLYVGRCVHVTGRGQRATCRDATLPIIKSQGLNSNHPPWAFFTHWAIFLGWRWYFKLLSSSYWTSLLRPSCLRKRSILISMKYLKANMFKNKCLVSETCSSQCLSKSKGWQLHSSSRETKNLVLSFESSPFPHTAFLKCEQITCPCHYLKILTILSIIKSGRGISRVSPGNCISGKHNLLFTSVQGPTLPPFVDYVQ